MLDIILWGTGKVANQLIDIINENIILVVDNDETKWGSMWHGYIINKPDNIAGISGKFDKIIIAVMNWMEIQTQIIKKYAIAPDLIENMYYRHKAVLMNKYKKEGIGDKKIYITYLKENPLDVFNDSFIFKYSNLNIEVNFDEKRLLYYVFYDNKRMYFSKRFCNEEQVRRYYGSIIMEQDSRSPHKYQTESFFVRKGDVVLDAGVAEGNFALDVIDLVEKIYLIEADPDWIEALNYTFEPYKDKVEIIEGFLGSEENGALTVDSIVKNQKIDFIKMDIEGAEIDALYGAVKTLEKNDIKLDICSYHHVDDERKIKEILKANGYRSAVSDGYMIFLSNINPYEENVSYLEFVRGLVRAYK